MSDPVTEPDPGQQRRHVRRRRRPVLRRVLFGVLALIVVTAAAAGWVTWRATKARAELRAASTLVSTLQQQLTARDVAGAHTTLTALQERTGRARSDTADPLWAVAAGAPFVGDDVRAVRALTVASDDLSRRALPGLVDAAVALDPQKLTPAGGQIALAPIIAAAPAIIEGDAQVRAIAVRVAALDQPGLSPAVRDAVRTLSGKLADAQQETASASRAVALLPPMLGASGPRTYLLVFQNLAEARGTGGIWGAWATIRADSGRLTMERQGSAGDINATGAHVALTPDQTAFYTDRMGKYFQDVNLTADFPSAAKSARELFRQAYGQTVDGVLATDPVALSYLLRGAKPVTLGGKISITADNAVQLLLNQVYLTVADPKQQDIVFAGAARAVFASISGGAGSGTTTIEGIRRAAAERRILVWSADAGEQDQLAHTGIAGSVTGSSAAPIRLFLNDGTGSKMDYYLQQSVDIVARNCTNDGATLSVTLGLQSTAPSAGLPDYVTGAGTYGVPVGTMRTNITLLAPTDGSVLEARVDGAPADMGTGLDQGRQGSVVTVDLAPGAKRTVTFDVLVTAGEQATGARLIGLSPAVRVTPTHWSGCASPGATP